MEGKVKEAVKKALLAAAGTPLTVEELAERTGLDERSAGHAAADLVGMGWAVLGQRERQTGAAGYVARQSIVTDESEYAKTAVRDALKYAGVPLALADIVSLTELDERRAGHAAADLVSDGSAVLGQKRAPEGYRIATYAAPGRRGVQPRTVR